MTIKNEIKNIISGIAGEEVVFSVEEPEAESHGDYATNIALVLAKKQKKNPMEIAEEIKAKIQNPVFLKIDVAAPGFVNFFISPDFLREKLKSVLKEGKNFGKQDIGNSKTIVIDYSSPNVAKPMHVGHLRSTFIGQAIYNLYKFLGYKVIGDNHLGDWGTQFGIMIAAIKKYGYSSAKLKKITVAQMLEIYIKYNDELKENPDLQETAKAEFKKLEDGDAENRKIWKILRDKSLAEFNKIYKILNIKFDLIKGESDYEKDLKQEIDNALEKKIALTNEDGSVIIPLGEDVPFLIRKSDGATVYGTRDLATIRFRVFKYAPEKIIYVIGNEQSFYLEQLFKAAGLLQYIAQEKLFHIKFGLVLDENRKKLSTREGRVVEAKELIKKITALSEDTIKEKNPALPEEERKEIAQKIGIAALKYNDLSQNRKTDIIFDWKKMLGFTGNSAPYLLYTYVRLQSIFKKSDFKGKFNCKFLTNDKEIEVLKEIVKFPDIVEYAAQSFQINYLTDYLFRLANKINNFYEACTVLKAEKDIRLARLALIKSALLVLKNGLNLLGIETVEKM